MKVIVDSAIHLLHEAGTASLATHSLRMAGFPYASSAPFALDERHCPVFMMSSLAEHTRNIMADSRAGIFVTASAGSDVQASERLSLAGNIEPAGESSELLQRYLRYQPEAERYAALGDFALFRMIPVRGRYIAGFGQMGWIEAMEWPSLAVLPLAEEFQLIEKLMAAWPNGMRLLGVDCYGIDLERNGQRKRLRFPEAPVATNSIGAAVAHSLATL